MTKRIFKYTVRINDRVHEVELDSGAEVLHVDSQYSDYLEDVVVFYAYAEDEPPSRQRRRFQVVGTGQRLPEGAEHRGSVTVKPFVWHLVELP